ncbi:MAG: histidine phosphatase family protein [Betaproteobacteria bacterium]|nr:histidine phosphatase family protein [Betaproteobacteria bacterium]
MKKLLCLIAVLVFAWFAPAPTPAQQPSFQAVPAPAAGRTSVPAKAIPHGQLLAELRKGGYVLYFRHTSTDFSRDDSKSQSDDDCANQRLLTDKGRSEARAVGAAMRELGIPVANVLASPRCRTMETAMLAFGRAEKTSAVRGGPANPEQADRYAGLRRLLTTPVKPGANLVIASHGNPFYAVAGKPYLAEGEAAVVQPLGADFEVVARIRADGWAALAEKK